MKQRYRLYKRKKGGRYYVHDEVTGKQDSLHTTDRATAIRLFHSRQEAEQQPAVNLQIARAYLAASDQQIATRNWQFVMDELVKLKKDQTQDRWQTAIKDKAFDLIRHLPLLETRPGTFFARAGSRESFHQCLSAAHSQLRLGHDLAAVAGAGQETLASRRVQGKARHHAWPNIWPLSPARHNPERKAFYKLAWHLGASQSDLAFLEAENVDWDNHVISYKRMKTDTVAIMRFDEDMAEILRDLPGSGPLFPYLRTVRAGDRATEFHQRCVGLGIKGVSLHSYRYAWAERAKTAGYPERYAQVNLGHNSKAMTRAYSRKAEVEMPSLSEYERQQKAIIGIRNIEPATHTVAA